VIETLDADFVYGLFKILGRSLYAYLHPSSRVDEINSHGNLSLLSMMKMMVGQLCELLS